MPDQYEEEDKQRGTCEDCPAKLSGDDKGDRCQDCQEQYDLLICGCCDERVENSGFGSSVNQGCCSDGACGHEPKIEVLCGDCGTWDEEDEVWRCPDCQEEHEEHLRIHRILIRGDPLPCETCKKPVWSNNDVYQKIHDCIVCQDCFDENEKAHEENDYCPICNKLTNTKNYCGSRTCCVCLEMTFCDDCVTDCKDKDCSHDWETHCICAKCEGDVNPPEPDGDGSGDE